MAAISNASDLILQSTVPRLTVTAVTIVPGSSGFLKDKNVLALSPATLSLSTILVGFTTAATYTWSYANSLNPTTFTQLVSGVGTSTYNITNTAFLTHVGLGTSVIYKCKVTQAGWTDAETTTTITYTKRANDIPVATLDKASILLPTDATDTVDYANSNSKIKVSIGGVNIPYGTGANTFSVVPAVTSGTITIGSASTTTTTITNDTRSFGILSGMAAGNTSATITYTVTARDVDNVETTTTLTQTISKATSGASGYVYKLTVPSIVLRRQDNINFTPTTITVSASLGIGSAAASPYSGIFKIYTSTNGSSYTLRETSTAVSSYIYTLQDYASTLTTNIKVELYMANGTTFIDSEIIPVNREGQIALNLTNDNHTISTGISGTATGLSIKSEAEIFLGLTKQLTGWTFAWTPSAGITITGAATSTVTVTDITADGIVTVVATETSTGQTKTADFTISRAITGATGINSYRIDLSNNNQTLRINAAGAVTSPMPVTNVAVYNGSALDAGWALTASYFPLTGVTGSFNDTTTSASVERVFTLGTYTNAALDAYVDITATKSGYATLTARLTLVKSPNAIIYELIPSVSGVSKNRNGVSTPSTVTFTAYQTDGNNVASVYAGGTIKVQGAISEGTFTDLITDVAGSTASYTIPAGTSLVNIKGILTVNGTAVDNETVPIVSDGINSYRIDLSNNNQTLRINAAGAVTSPMPVTNVAVYNGSALDAGWTLTASYFPLTGVTGSFNDTTTSASVERVFTLGTYTNAALDAYVDITATKSGYATLTARLALVKSPNAIIYELIPSVSGVSKNTSGVSTPSTVTFTAYQTDGNNVASVYAGGTIKVQGAVSGGGFADLITDVAGSTASYTIPAGTSLVNIKGILTVNGTAVDNETVPIVSDGSTGASGYTLTVTGGVRTISYNSTGSSPSPSNTTTYTATVYQNGVALTGTSNPAPSYAWSSTGLIVTGAASTNAQTFTPGSITGSWALTITTVTVTVTIGSVVLTQVIPISVNRAGAQGDPGVQSATVYLYQWSTATPSPLPSGFSTYQWSNNSNYDYTITGDNWSTTVPANPGTPGIYLWYATKSIVASAGTSTSSVNWSSGYTIAASTGNGIAGQKTARPSLYQWAAGAGAPAITNGTSSYVWTDNTISGTLPASWLTTQSTSPSPGYTLWQATVSISDAATATTTPLNWTTASILPVGYAGNTGAQARVMYARIPSPSSNPQATAGTVTVTGDNRPTGAEASAVWNASFNVTWYTSDPDPTSANSLYQADGIYSPSANTTSWSAPYISSLKVGNLSAVSVNTGSLTVTGDLTVGTVGSIKGGQSAFNTGSGFFLGYDAGYHKFSIGSATRGLYWDGTNLNFAVQNTSGSDISKLQIDYNGIIGSYNSVQNLNISPSWGLIDLNSYMPTDLPIIKIRQATTTPAQNPLGIDVTLTGSGTAVYASSSSGYGIRASSGSSQAIRATSGSSIGVYASSSSNIAISALSGGSVGIAANCSGAAGAGIEASGYGTGGFGIKADGDAVGVQGQSSNGTGYPFKAIPNAQKASMSLGLHSAKPTGTASAGDIAVISVSGGNYLAWYDGSNWYRVPSATIIP